MLRKPIEFRLLGRLGVLRDPPVELPPSKKARALLAYLVATERAHDRGHLAGLLWDERDDARAALRWALSRLRPVVDDERTRLSAERDLVGFERGDADVDLTSVRLALREGIDRVPTETLEEVVSRFRGELLEGLDLPECYGFHAWCIAEREAARVLRASILEAIVGRHAGDPERALPFARSRLDLDPLAGAAQASVVRNIGALGRVREAEELYESFKSLVQARLGQRASGELERARLAIKRSPPAAPSPAVFEPLARLARSPFVGRERELATLTAALDGAVAGAGALLEISGEAGMGKSRLVSELLHQARLRGARVLVGRCLEGDGSPAFLPFLDSLDAALGDESDLERLAGADAALAARLFPRFAARLGEPPAPGAADATSERYLVFQAVATLLERLAAPSGAVLVIEDLHWIDQPSLALLRYLAGRLDGMRLLVVATYRDEDLDGRQREALVDLRRQGGKRVSLRGLSTTEVHALVSALGGAEVPAALQKSLADTTGGHPLFVQEMLKHLVEENALGQGTLSVPDGVRQVIGRRLARLSEPAKRLLGVCSAMIGAFRWELVREVSKDDEDELLDALEQVLAAQLLHEGETAGFATYEFSHRLVAQVLYESLPLPRRARLNRQIGEAIERLHPSSQGAELSALAHHFYLAVADGSGKAKAAEYALRAAERAASLVAFEEAARHYQRAAELLADEAPARLPEIHRQRGRALAVVSAWNEGCEAYELALASAAGASDEWRAEVLVELGRAALWAMNMPAVYSRAREADALVRSLGREDLTLAVGGMLAQCMGSAGELSEAIQKYSELWPLRRDRHVPSLAIAPLTLYWNGRIDEALVWADESLAAARKANDIVSLMVGLPPLGLMLAASGRYREARATFAEARAIAERARATSLLARAVSMSTGFHLDLGDVDSAEDLASEAYELARSAGWSPGSVSAGIDLVTCRLRRGDIGAAEELLEAAARAAGDISGRKQGVSGFHDFLWSIRLAWARAELAAARGLHDDVERYCGETLERATGGRPKYEAAALVTRARSRAERGLRAEALADLDRALDIARASRDPALLLRAAVPRCALEGSDALHSEISAIEQQIEARR